MSSTPMHDIPKEITEAAILLEHYFKRNGYKDWQFMGVCDRSLAYEYKSQSSQDIDKRIDGLVEECIALGENVHPLGLRQYMLSIALPIAQERDKLRRKLEASEENFEDIRSKNLTAADIIQSQGGEIADLKRKIEASEAAAAEMREAIDSKIFGLSIYGYLMRQFPATVGHIPISYYFTRLGNSLANTIGQSYIRSDHPAIQRAVQVLSLISNDKHSATQAHVELATEALTALQNLKEGK